MTYGLKKRRSYGKAIGKEEKVAGKLKRSEEKVTVETL
jgi:hypothetical protein